MLKNQIKSTIIQSRILKLINMFSKKGVVILRYHTVQDNPEQTDTTIGAHIMHSTESFRKQMEIIAREYDPITLDDLLAFINGEKDISNKSVVITFDDGYTDNYEIVAPIMNHYGVPGTFYITTNSIGNKTIPFFIRTRYAFFTTKIKEWTDPIEGKNHKLLTRDDRITAMRLINNHCVILSAEDRGKFVTQVEESLETESSNENFMMSWEQVTDLHKQGHIIGSHTLSHPNLARIPYDDMKREIVESKKIIDTNLKTNCIHFSYPNPGLDPQWNDETTAVIRDAGYKTAVLSTQGSVFAQDNPFILKRAAVPTEADEFRWNLDWTLIGRDL